MAIITPVIALNANNPTLIASGANGRIDDPIPVLVQNNDGAIDIFIGGPNVTAATGIKLPHANGLPGPLQFQLRNNDILYAIAASATPNINVMLGRQ